MTNKGKGLEAGTLQGRASQPSGIQDLLEGLCILAHSLEILISQSEVGLRVCISFSFFFFFVFLGPHPRHMEVPRLGVQSEL